MCQSLNTNIVGNVNPAFEVQIKTVGNASKPIIMSIGSTVTELIF